MDDTSGRRTYRRCISAAQYRREIARVLMDAAAQALIPAEIFRDP
jgi:hypothetical protein